MKKEKIIPRRTSAPSPGSGPALRKRAEDALAEKIAGIHENLEALSPDKSRQVLHELRVHQIELEMQNEELRQTQGKLEALRAGYFDLYDLAPVGYITLNERGLILETNLTAAALLGGARDALIKQPVPSFIHPEDQDLFYRRRKQLFETGAPQFCEIRMVRADRSSFWVRLDLSLAQDADGAPVGRATMIDLTERKQAEQELMDSKGLTERVVENIPLMIFLKEAKDLRFVMFNRAGEELLGYERRDLIGKNDLDQFPSEQAAFFIAKDREVLNGELGFLDIPEEHILTAKKGLRLLHTRKVCIRGSDGFTKYLLGISEDITERRENEQQQALAMQVLATLNRQNDIGLLVDDILHQIKESTGFEAVAIRLNNGEDFPYYVTNGFSPSFIETERFLCERDLSGKANLDGGGNPILECMCGNVIRGRFDPAQPFFTERGSFWTNSTSDLLASTTETERQARTRNRCNGEGYESVALIPLRFGNEVIGLLQINDHRRGIFTREKIRFFEVMGAGIGIAVARRNLAMAMEQSLREKEVLIKEIHHRVKNNMQVMSSLLSLQSNATANEECRGILKDARTRIHAMSLIHQKLYQSKSLVRIDFGEYIDFLASHLLQICQINSDQIRLEMDLGRIQLDINSAVPAGLLVNELIVNTLKHAFPDGRKGVVKIGLKREPDGTVEIRVADDGIGFPEGLDFRKSESFGMQVINLVAGQLEATIDLDRTAGTAFIVTFRELEYALRV